jgi:glycosyltransferase involved in cell wall biosynthesis
MYAGNHSPCNPLDTLLGAARLLKDRDDILFLFAGGGSELDKMKETAVQQDNIRWLPYQAQTELSAMLSAADLHVVVMGDAFTGIIHPSKIYNILAVGSPFLFIGPPQCHIADILARTNGGFGQEARHGEVRQVAQLITNRAAEPSQEGRRRLPALEPALPSQIVEIIEAAGAGVTRARNLKAVARASAAHS